MAFFVKSLLVYFALLFVEYAHGELKVSSRKGIFMYDGWCYGTDPVCGEQTWTGMCQTGTHQSPIDLPAMAGLPEKEAISFDKKFFNLDHYIAINNGLAYRILSDFKEKEPPKLTIPYLGATYIYKSFHIHWGSDSSKGSEHSVQGKYYPAEMHLLLYKDTHKSLTDALAVVENNAVVAFTFFLIDSPTSTVLSELEDHVPLVTSNMTSTKPLDLSGLFKSSAAWAYYGASPVPPCYENIAFLIFEEPVEVSAGFINKLREMKNAAGTSISNNFKSVGAIKDQKPHRVPIHYSKK